MSGARQVTELGRTGLRVSPIGLGTSQFAGGTFGNFYAPLPQADIDVIVRTALTGGITLFDTAEGYGRGRAERSLAEALARAGAEPGSIAIATKWTPLGRTARSIGRTIATRTANLAPFPVDLFQIHTGFGSLSSIRAQARAMGRLVEAGKIRAVGVSNFSARKLEIAHDELARRGVALASNQVQINLLHRQVERNGVLDTARRLGVTLIAYVPLRSGLLTGKFHDDRSTVARLPRMRRMMIGLDDKKLDRSAPLIDTMRGIAREHQATAGQVALAWLVGYYDGVVVAIPGASKPRHAEEAAGALGVELSQAELQTLARVSTAVTGGTGGK